MLPVHTRIVSPQCSPQLKGAVVRCRSGLVQRTYTETKKRGEQPAPNTMTTALAWSRQGYTRPRTKNKKKGQSQRQTKQPTNKLKKKTCTLTIKQWLAWSL
ncbi:hypothetical protein PGIGA_G00087970 [Pangasianodon gigas]|uniref:Uncharacterized protein n=1 Tax=Pangasianodon gigas TaxID=30993 RepID=A0ACC5XBG6_PANGG|nr:hypothetical protein [Pangasianodon gigas]